MKPCELQLSCSLNVMQFNTILQKSVGKRFYGIVDGDDQGFDGLQLSAEIPSLTGSVVVHKGIVRAGQMVCTTVIELPCRFVVHLH